jgi:hypothetical protein
MDYAVLISEVAGLLAAHPDWTDQQIADGLNAKTITDVAKGEVMVRYRTLIGAYGPALADAVIDALQAAAAAGNKTIARILPTVLGDGDSSGIDAASVIVRATIDGLVPAVLTADQAAKIKALGEVQVSRAEQLGFTGVVGPGHVKAARDAIGQ